MRYFGGSIFLISMVVKIMLVHDDEICGNKFLKLADVDEAARM